MSLECLSQISIDRNISKTSQKHLKRDVFFCGVFKTSQIHLKKDVFFVTSLRRLKRISKKMCILWPLCYLSKIYVESICDCSKISHKNGFVLIKTLFENTQWNVVFWDQCIAINHSAMGISGPMFACGLSHNEHNLIIIILYSHYHHNLIFSLSYNKIRLKLQASNYIYKKGGSGTGVFLRLEKHLFCKITTNCFFC